MPSHGTDECFLIIVRHSVSLQNFSIFTSLKVNLSENGCFLTNQGGHLIAEIASSGPCQITAAVVGMNLGSR